ncbi:MAG: branched-chain amino acid ABC transporter permease [Oculatellaceae cyanobacterium Prado106]|jgi:neutral amino acid transport system permease protein|nr:branched-chain amino acid ABC transporter permease [Oculatellaceae cyanobacterium Prado106]
MQQISMLMAGNTLNKNSKQVDTQLIQLLVNGIAVGSIIALASVGLTLTYGILRLANFAHGDFMTLGAYLTLTVNWGLSAFLPAPLGWLNMGLSIALGAVLTIAVALVIEKLLWSRMRDRRASSTTLIILSIGLALFLRNAIILIWGTNNQKYNLPIAAALDVFGIKIALYRVIVVVLAIVVILGLHYLLQNTRIGKAMRAVADNVDLARVSGINVEQIVIWTWVIAAGLTAVSGGLYGLITAVRPNMGWFLILPLFVSVILGGIGNPYGAIAGAFIVGIAQEVGTYWVPPQYKLGIALLLMVVVLLVRPQGIFKGTM